MELNTFLDSNTNVVKNDSIDELLNTDNISNKEIDIYKDSNPKEYSPIDDNTQEIDIKEVQYRLFVICMQSHITLITSNKPFAKSIIGLKTSKSTNYLTLTHCYTDSINKFSNRLYIHPSIIKGGQVHVLLEELCNNEVQILEKNGYVRTFNIKDILNNQTEEYGLSTVQYKNSTDDEKKILPYLKLECLKLNF